MDHNHEYRNPDVYIYKQGCRVGKDDRVLIDDGTWLGTNVVVVGNVYISKQCGGQPYECVRKFRHDTE